MTARAQHARVYVCNEEIRAVFRKHHDVIEHAQLHNAHGAVI